MDENKNMQNTELEILTKKADKLYNSKENINEQEALKIFLEISEKYPDDNYSVYSIGHAYEYGRGTEKNVFKAKEYYEKAVNLGSTGAMVRLGVLNEFGELGEVNIEKAKEYYIQGDKLGNISATKNLGLLLRDENNSDCVEWLKKAFEKGDFFAPYALANIYLDGKIVPQDIQIGVDFLHKAVELGNIEAALDLAFNYLNGKNVDVDTEKGVSLMFKAAEGGNAVAANNLSIMFEQGNSVVTDINKSFEWAKRAAELGESDQIFSFALKYYNGTDSIAEDKSKAVELFILAANAGSYVAMDNLATIYYNGFGIEKSCEKAVEWCKKAAKKGFNPAIEKIKSLYILSDPENGKHEYFELMKEIASDGYYEAMLKVSCCYQFGIGTETNEEMAITYLDKAVAGNYPQACYEKGMRYLLGKDGVEQNLSEGIKILEIAVEKEYPAAVEALGSCYKDGVGVGKDSKKAIELYEKARSLGLLSSIVCLGTAYDDGGFAETNLEKAVEYYMEASEQGSINGTYFLAGMYENGTGVEKDEKKAFELYSLNAEKGDADSMFKVALYYYNEIGVEQNREKAIEYAERAKLNGNEYAQELLDFIANREEQKQQNFEEHLRKIEEGDVSSIAYVANAYMYGAGVDVDIEKAIKYFELGISKNDYKSMADYSFSWHIKLDRETFLNIDGKELLRVRKLAEKVVAECPEEDIVNTAKKTLEMHQSIINMIIMEAQHCLHPFEDTDLSKYYPERGLTLLEVLTEYENMVAPYLLGEYYSDENNNAVDFDKAKKYLEISIAYGYHVPKMKLGKMYHFGLGMEKNPFKATQLLEEYIEVARTKNEQSSTDYISSVLLLGIIYDGHLKQINKAIPYYREAAQAGVPMAQRILGIQYAKGEGLEKNYDTALFWLKKAMEGGDKNAATGIQNVFNLIELEKDEKSSLPNSQQTAPANSSSQSSTGCYVATCVYGSYDCPEVWTLRRYRDFTLAKTWYGRTFIKTYYAISPTIVKYFGETKWFKTICKGKLDTMVKNLQNGGVESTSYEDK